MGDKIEHFRKVFSIVCSCETVIQLDAAKRLIENFHKIYNEEKLTNTLIESFALTRAKIEGFFRDL